MEIDVKHVAKLAMLRFAEEDLAAFSEEFSGIVHMVEHLPPLPAEGTLLDADTLMELRADIVQPSAAREALLANAPKTQDGCFAVPRVVE